MADVLKSFIKELPEQDPFQEVAKEIPLVKKLIDNGTKDILVIDDLSTGRIKNIEGIDEVNFENKKIIELAA